MIYKDTSRGVDKKGTNMFELLTIIVFVLLMFKTIGLMFKLTWGAAKIVSGILMVFALPVLIFGVFFVGGIVLLVPIIMVCIAAGIIKTCVRM